MAYLGVVEAVLARLQGQAKTYVPLLPRTPEHHISGSAELDSKLRPHSHVRIAHIDVPIYHFGPDGRDMKSIRPCFTFDMLGVNPRYEEYVFDSQGYKGDYAVEGVEHSKATIQVINDKGDYENVTAPLLLKTRPVQHPYDFLIEIQAQADDDVISAMMVEHIYGRVFTPRDFLRVPMRDGSYRSWDVIFVNFQDLDSRQAVRSGSPGIERQYSKVWTYKVEGYLDNTDQTELVNAVRSRRLTMTKG